MAMFDKKEQPKRKEDFDIDRRRARRITKHYVLTYFDKTIPEKKFEITQLRNISSGGMCFITTRCFATGTLLGVELKTPYLSGTTHLSGRVLQSHEKVKNMIYETRLQFEDLGTDAAILIGKLIEVFADKETTPHE